jgi:meso-butanediol dehydrogenase/(S,S)-butanediol dehydrogenase/diacetyl reductase
MEDIFKPDAFADKVALITGATSGLGAETARQFAAHGASVMLVGRNAERGEALKAEIEAAGGTAALILADVADSAACDKLVTATVARFGRIDIMFNNAGVVVTTAMIDTTDEDFERVMRINLFGSFYMARATVRQMLEQGSGSIVNMGSDAGLQGYAGMCTYGSTKAAVIHMTKCLALETADRNIRVNVICPGDIDTPMQDAGYGEPDMSREEMLAAVASTIPMKRHGQPVEIARTVMYLASDAAKFLHGTVCSVDGGAAAGRSFIMDEDT